MLKSYFTTAIRHLLKNKSYTILNVVGLSVGLACFTLISLWVYDELSYDRFHEKADRIYRIGGTFTDESGQFDQAVTCIPLAPALKSDLPEVEDALRIDLNDALVQLDDKKFVEDGLLAVDPSFLNFFDFKLISGDASTALQEPYTILLSESMGAAGLNLAAETFGVLTGRGWRLRRIRPSGRSGPDRRCSPPRRWLGTGPRAR
jgi:putative ABC transport system permease protein